jgi:hypothetical protein
MYHIYKLTVSGLSYYGITTDIDKRKWAHCDKVYREVLALKKGIPATGMYRRIAKKLYRVCTLGNDIKVQVNQRVHISIIATTVDVIKARELETLLISMTENINTAKKSAYSRHGMVRKKPRWTNGLAS